MAPAGERFDVAVIGRGLVGSAAARHLAETGYRTTVIGAGEPADYTTSDGPFSSHYDQGRITRITATDPVWSELAARSISRYGDISARSGVDFYKPCGLAFVRADDGVDLATALALGADARVVAADWLRETTGIAVPHGDAEGVTVVYEGPPAGRINPRRMIAAQTLLAEHAGAVVVNAAVTSVHKDTSGFGVSVGSDEIRADRLLLATGAYGAGLVGVDLPLERRLRTIVLAELGPGEEIPCLIHDDPPHPELDGIYWVPPVAFQDGRTLLKIGGDSLPMRTATTSQEIRDWFHQGGSTAEAAALRTTLQTLLPDAGITAWDHKPCVVTYTPTGRPYVDWVDEGVAVALGGCGAMAKSADEVGRLAATLCRVDAERDPLLDAFSLDPSR